MWKQWTNNASIEGRAGHGFWYKTLKLYFSHILFLCELPEAEALIILSGKKFQVEKRIPTRVSLKLYY